MGDETTVSYVEIVKKSAKIVHQYQEKIKFIMLDQNKFAGFFAGTIGGN